jgi:hypothetical protein
LGVRAVEILIREGGQTGVRRLDPVELEETDVFRCEQCHNRTTSGAVCVTHVGLLCRRCADRLAIGTRGV